MKGAVAALPRHEMRRPAMNPGVHVPVPTTDFDWIGHGNSFGSVRTIASADDLAPQETRRGSCATRSPQARVPDNNFASFALLSIPSVFGWRRSALNLSETAGATSSVSIDARGNHRHQTCVGLRE